MLSSCHDTRRKSVFGAALLSGALLTGAALSGCSGDEAAGPADTGKISLVTPKGGESYTVGDTLWVKWTVKDDPDPVDAVDVMLSPDDGKSWGFLRSGSIGTASPLWGNFGWSIKDSIEIGAVKHGLAGNTSVRIRVMQYSTDEADKIATTASAITIKAP
jgi:hypothetical protein